MKNTDLIIFSGQSLGGKFFLPRHSDGWGTAQNCALLSSWRKRTNMVTFFCDTYIKETGRKVIAVHSAKGATAISRWQQGQISYDLLVKKTKAAIDMTTPEHIYFVWIQVESDALAKTTKEQYKTLIKSLNKSLNKDLGVEKFCNILVGKFSMDEYDNEIINAQKEIFSEENDFLMVSTITKKIWGDTKYMNPYAFGYYSCDGLEIIGRDAATNLANYIKTL